MRLDLKHGGLIIRSAAARYDAAVTGAPNCWDMLPQTRQSHHGEARGCTVDAEVTEPKIMNGYCKPASQSGM